MMMEAAQLTPEQIISSGRREACKIMAYFSKLIHAFVFFETDAVPTLAVSRGLVVMYNREWSSKLTVLEMAAAILHEAGHPTRNHFVRYLRVMGCNPGDYAAGNISRNPQLGRWAKTWNIAGDMCINEILEKAGVQLPKGYIVPRTYDLPEGQTTEWYFEKLRDNEELQKERNEGGGECGSGECGSCAGNTAAAEASLPDDIGRSAVEVDQIKKQVATDIKKHNKARGNVPQALCDWADEQLRPPQIPWDRKFSRLIRRAVSYKNGQTDLGFDRPSRRTMLLGGYGPNKPILPRRRSPVARVAVCGDTSGSMSNHDLTDIMATVHSITRHTHSDLLFCAIDAKVHALRKIKRWSDAKDLLIGRGGTDFRPAFTALQNMGRDRPDIVVFVTDGAGPAPQVAPAWCSIIWVLVGVGATPPATYGEAINIEDTRDAA